MTTDNTLEFKLMLDAEEIEATIQLTKEKFQQLANEAENAGRSINENMDPGNSITQALASEGREVDHLTNDLKEGTAAKKAHSAALNDGVNTTLNVVSSVSSLVEKSDSATDSQKKFIESISQGITAYGLATTAVEGLALAMGTTVSGGLVVAIGAVVGAGVLLTEMLSNNTEDVKKQKQEVDKLKDSWTKLTREQLNNYIQSREDELRKIEAAHPKEQIITYKSEMGATLQLPTGKEVSGKERFGNDNDRVNRLNAELTALKGINTNLGESENIQNRISNNKYYLKKLSENETSEFYYKKFVKTANSLKEAQTIIRQWIISDEKLVKEDDKSNVNNNGLATEKKQYEELTGKVEELNLRKKETLSEYDKEIQILHLKTEAELKGLEAEEKFLAEKAKKEPNEDNTTKLKNIRLQKTIVEKQADIDDTNLKKTHNGKMIELDFQLHQEQLKAQKATDIQLIQDKIEHLQKQYDLETADADKKKEINIKILAAENELTKAKEQNAKKILELGQARAQTVNEQYEKEYALAADWYKKTLEEYKDIVGAKIIIDEIYAQKKDEINKKVKEKELEIASQTIGSLAQLMGKQTAAYKVLAAAQAIIDTYKAANVALASAPPPWNFIAMAGVIATGLANVINIEKTDTTVKGFTEGGILPKGKKGFFEGYGNEIVAPEEDFITIAHQLIGLSVIDARNYFNTGWGNDNSILINEVKMLRGEIKDISSRPARAYLDHNEAQKIGDYYDGQNRSSR